MKTSAIDLIDAQLEKFKAVSTKHIDRGACDTEPEYEFQNWFRKNLTFIRDEGVLIDHPTPSFIPTSTLAPSDPHIWGLYAYNDEEYQKSLVASEEMTKVAQEVYSVLLPWFLFNKEAREHIKGKFWRIDLY